MPIADCQLPIEKQPFTPNEKRELTLDAKRIAPEYLVDGKAPLVDAEHKRTEKYPTHNARFFQLEILNPQSSLARQACRGLTAIRIQLNHGDPADDEARLAAIAEDLLAPKPDAIEATRK